MNIVIRPEVMIKLMTFANIVAPQEFSGFGFVKRNGPDLDVYDAVILDVGSQGYTEIPTKKLLELMERPDCADMKLWLHRHPIDVWSSTDLHTILEEPLGGIPDMVKWSASMVLTPHGWIGRVDNYIKHTYQVCSVLPSLEEVYQLKSTLVGEEHASSNSGKLKSRLEEIWKNFETLAQDLEVTQDDLLYMMDDGTEEDGFDEEPTEQDFHHSATYLDEAQEFMNGRNWHGPH